MKQHAFELFRYVVNGLLATGIHFCALYLCLNTLRIPLAGIANLIAATFGITVSFLGSRYFVFPHTGERIYTQAIKFSGFYGAIAILHGIVLFVWSDLGGYDYRTGFLLATFIQVSLSYVGNKFLIFKVSI